MHVHIHCVHVTYVSAACLCVPHCYLSRHSVALCVLLFRNTVEKEEKKTLVQAGVNITDRVFTPEEVRAYSSMLWLSLLR